MQCDNLMVSNKDVNCMLNKFVWDMQNCVRYIDIIQSNNIDIIHTCILRSIVIMLGFITTHYRVFSRVHVVIVVAKLYHIMHWVMFNDISDR